MPHLYIHEKYNVKTYLIQQGEQFLGGIRNAIANTVMKKTLLPSAILILFNNDILENAVFTIECIEGLMRWLLDKIHKILKYQIKCLPPKSKKYEEPRVYIVKALPKPSGIAYPSLFKGVRRKYNQTLQNMLEDYHMFGFINVHKITTRHQNEKYFISQDSGKLSDEGMVQFWLSISQTFKAMDKRRKAKTLVASKETQTDSEMFRFTNTQERDSTTPRRFNHFNNNYRGANYSREQNWRRY